MIPGNRRSALTERLFVFPELHHDRVLKTNAGLLFLPQRSVTMEIVHVEKDGNFTWMKNIHLRDRFLSLKAKGLLSVMFSLPKDWDCTITGLAYISKEGISAISATIKELEAAGYITRERIRNEAGQLKDMKYTIHETPVNREP